MVLFAHSSVSSRHSPRNRFVAGRLQERGLATLLVDLLARGEEAVDDRTVRFRVGIGPLAGRLVGATDWLGQDQETRGLKVGDFGASTGGGAALVAVERPNVVGAVISRGGRPDLAGPALPHVRAPTLLIVGGNDEVVIEMNRKATDATPLREAPGDRPRRDPPLRGAGGARGGRTARGPMGWPPGPTPASCAA
ncbi:MAG: hydrolase [Singulisphaera sp.]|nr:hydrolase [Singulisphaera sp.]